MPRPAEAVNASSACCSCTPTSRALMAACPPAVSAPGAASNAKVGRHLTKVKEVWSISAKGGRNWPNFGQHRRMFAELVRRRASLAQHNGPTHLPESATQSAELGPKIVSRSNFRETPEQLRSSPRSPRDDCPGLVASGLGVGRCFAPRLPAEGASCIRVSRCANPDMCRTQPGTEDRPRSDAGPLAEK